MERVINSQLIDYLLKNNLITSHQHGFLKKNTTCITGSLLGTTNDWILALDKFLVTVKFFSLSKFHRTRGHPYKIYKQSCRLNVSLYSFHNRIVNVWNMLPFELVCTPTAVQFKRKLELLDFNFIYLTSIDFRLWLCFYVFMLYSVMMHASVST